MAVVDGTGRVVAIDAAGEVLLGHDGLRARPGTDWPGLEDAAISWLVARREPVDGPDGTRLLFVHLAGLDPDRSAPGPARAPSGRAADHGYLAAVVECLDTGVFALDADLALVLMNAALRGLHGHGGSLAGAGWPGRPDVLHVDGSALADEDRLIALTLRAGELRGLRRAIRHEVTGELRQVSVNGRTVRTPDGAFAGLAFAVHDVQDVTRAQGELAWLAGHDELTGLLNRRGMHDTVEAERLRRGAPHAVLVCDVDHFKVINDRFGHAAGDDALRLIGQALTSCAGSGRLVARLGGDEFVVVSWDPARHLEEDLRDAVADQDDQGRGYPLSITTGYAEQASDHASVEVLVARADTAMYGHRQRRRRVHDR